MLSNTDLHRKSIYTLVRPALPDVGLIKFTLSRGGFHGLRYKRTITGTIKNSNEMKI